MVTIFVLSTLLTGLAFYLLGLMQLGKSKHNTIPIHDLHRQRHIQPIQTRAIHVNA
jgi:hypothetical protein